MYTKIGFIYFSYWRVENDTFLQQCLKDFSEVVFFDLRNLFPALATDETNAPFSEEKLPYKPIRFESMKDFKRYLQEEKIVVVNGFGEQIFATWKLSYLLKKFNVPMIAVQNNSGLRNVLAKKPDIKIQKLNRLQALFNKLFFLSYLTLLKIGVLSKYDIYFISGKKLLKTITQYQTKFNEVVPINSHVYDKFLNEKQTLRTSEEYIVFLDIAMPFMLDFQNWGMKALEPRQYYRELNEFFTKIESLTGKKVVICAHPQFSKDKKEEFFPDREVFWFQTNEYIMQASLVLVHYTNAIQYAILHDKPILLLDDASLNSYIRHSIDYCSDTLNIQKLNYTDVNIDILEKLLESVEVNHKKYADFKNSYLINEGDEDITSVSKCVTFIKNKYNFA